MAARRHGGPARGGFPAAPGGAGAGAAGGGFGNRLGGGLPGGSNVRGGSGLSRPPGAGVPSQLSQIMRFDRNRDGRVTPDEVPAQLRPFLKRFDMNRDGALDLKEIRMMGSHGSGKRGGR